MYILFALLFAKHFALDYPLQTPWMLRKSDRTGWLAPLTAHAWGHAFFTGVILLLFSDLEFAVAMMVVDFVAHWSIDYWKAQRTSSEFGSPAFWNYLGLDQLFHNLTYLAIIFMYSLYMTGL